MNMTSWTWRAKVVPAGALRTAVAMVVTGVVASVVVSTVGPDVAKAGDVLHFKTGLLRSTDIQNNLRGQGPLWLHQALQADHAKSRYYVVQFKRHIGAEQHRQLQAIGARVFRYVPDDALIVGASAEQAARIRAKLDGVQTVLPYLAQWKVSPEFHPASVFTQGAAEKVLIRLFAASESEQVVRDLRRTAGVSLEYVSDRSLVATIELNALELVAAIEGVEWLQPMPEIESLNFKVQQSDLAGAPLMAGDYRDLSGYESGTRLMNFPTAWQRTLAGQGQIVAASDTGLDKGDAADIHGDFRGRADGQNFGLGAKNWEDPMGHGSHVSGSIAGSGDASGGLLRGGAPGAKLVMQGMWSPILDNLSVPPKLATLFSKAQQAGASIHSNSWGAARNFGVYDSMAAQVDEYMFANPDFLIIFAAGNSGVDMDRDGRIDPDSIGTPGTAKNALTVGASENLVSSGGIQKKIGELRGAQENWSAEPIFSDTLSNNPMGLAMFSSRGPTDDGRTKPDVVAPGTNVLSTRSRHPKAQPLWGFYNDSYLWAGGTSMATPLTAGAAAVTREYLQKQRNIAQPSAALLKAVLMHTAVDLFPGQYGTGGKAQGQELLTQRPNSVEGWGRVDVSRSTDLAQTMIVDERAGVATEQTLSYAVKLPKSAQLTVTLVWTDAPGSPSVAKALVNDLDLLIVDSAGQEISGNDHVNNNEIIARTMSAGDYQVRVRGTSVPQGMNGKQPFALLVSAQ